MEMPTPGMMVAHDQGFSLKVKTVGMIVACDNTSMLILWADPRVGARLISCPIEGWDDGLIEPVRIS